MSLEFVNYGMRLREGASEDSPLMTLNNRWKQLLFKQ